jgi:Antibiotic biosynthesis monooxygenase
MASLSGRRSVADEFLGFRQSLLEIVERKAPMKAVMVRYKVKPERAAENEELVRAVYEELRSNEPGGLRYATFQLDDGVSFAHVALVDTDDGENPLSEVKAFAEFQKGIGDRCEEPPVATPMREVGSYRLFGE